ncbi:hypothetical protein OF83DRAFT_219369, partial [Amylostereum chailletii]
MDGSMSASDDHKLSSERSRPHRAFKIEQRATKDNRGRKRKHEDKQAQTSNWTNSLLFEQIIRAGREAGPRMRPTEIVKILQRRNPNDFAKITPQVIGRYIDRSSSLPKWKPSVLNRVKDRAGAKPGGHNTRSGVLDAYPALVNDIVEQLLALRRTGIPVSVEAARGIMLGHIYHHAPKVLEATASDGSRFRCSDAFVRKFLYARLRWVPRASTRAAQKTPDNAEQQLWELFLRLVVIFRDADIRDASLFINFDQTQVVVADPSKRTFEHEGVKQVNTTSKEEKRAWTAVVGVAADGSVLPTQVIMKGSTERSLSSPNAVGHDEANQLGFLFNTNPKNYWSSVALLEEY